MIEQNENEESETSVPLQEVVSDNIEGAVENAPVSELSEDSSAEPKTELAEEASPAQKATVQTAEKEGVDSAENTADDKNTDKKKKKKLPFVLRFIRGLFIFVLVLAVLLLSLFAFCALDKRTALSTLPNNYSLYVHTDSAWDTVDPLLDLQAADVLLSSDGFKDFRSVFMNLRGSPIRTNKAFRFVAARAVDAALYDDYSAQQDFVAIIDMGFLSFVTRPLEFIYKNIYPKQSFVSVDGLTFTESEVFSCFEFSADGAAPVYFKSSKNLVVASSNKELLMASLLAKNDLGYTPEQKKMLSVKTGNDLRIVANARKLASGFISQNDIISNLLDLLPSNELSVISLNISDSDISLNCQIPFAFSDENPTPINEILHKKSSAPSFLSKMSDLVQYYTILNAGTLEELKTALLPFVPVKNADGIWSKADSACKLAFGINLSDLLFSWSGSEFAALGIENQNDPVFAIQIADERKRQEVFDKFTSSIFIKDDNSLILDGVRLPRLEMPSFLSWVLSMFQVTIPKPYFMVLDNFIYFSESAESLSSIFTSYNAGKSLVKSDNWKTVSSGLKNESTISLFYNLDRSMPFFIRGNKMSARVLELYTIGRFDVRIANSSKKGGTLSFQLHASARKSGNLRMIPGFPVQLERGIDAENFVIENKKNPEFIFWADRSSVFSMELASLKINSVETTGASQIVAASGKNKNGVLWAVTGDGFVYLFDKSLNAAHGFPVILGEHSAANPVAVDDGLIVPLVEGGIAFVSASDGSIKTLLPDSSVKAAPFVLGNVAAVYDKQFLGGIYFIDTKTLECTNESSPVEVDGIAFGSPAMLKSAKKTYTALVTQAGLLNIWEDSENTPVVQKELPGTFTGEIVASQNYFYALSTDAILYRISANGDVLSVKITDSTAKNGYICVRMPENSGRSCVYVNADSNVIYGFNENLELLSGFPLTGWGKPLFADVNGDKTADLIALTLDKKIIAWNLR